MIFHYRKKNLVVEIHVAYFKSNEWQYVLFKVKYTPLSFTLDEYLSFKLDGVSEASSSYE